MTNLFDLTGRRALITGAARGIGFTLAKGLAAQGAAVVINDRDGAPVTAAVGRLADEGVDAVPCVFDVTDERQVSAEIDRIEKEAGPIDILANNAGIQVRAMLNEVSSADFGKILDVHVRGSFHVARAAARHMIGRGHGKIINISSIQGERARASIGPYTAAKGAVKMLTKAMTAEWATHGLNINAIAPGYLRTELTLPIQSDPVFTGWLEKRVPQGGWGTPEDLVGACVFLASGASDFVNGHVLVVDGGMIATL